MNQPVLKGIVLAGGKSLRFGEDKALAEINGERLIEKPIRLLKALGLAPVVITSSARDYSFLDCQIENDLIPEKGPLGGLYTAFQLFPQASLLSLTCDMPNLTESALGNLIQAQQPSALATLFRFNENIFQPFPGIYSPWLMETIEFLLRSDELSMQTFLSRIELVTFVSPPLEPLFFTNINFRDDLK